MAAYPMLSNDDINVFYKCLYRFSLPVVFSTSLTDMVSLLNYVKYTSSIDHILL